MAANDSRGIMTNNPNRESIAHESFQKGRRLARSEKYREAIAAFTRAIREDAEFGDAYFKRGACYYQLGRWRQASADMDAASLLGCQVAGLWSQYETTEPVESEDEREV